jgi:cullin 1
MRRRAMMDACIVRIMKSRRELPVVELIALCIEQLFKQFEAQRKQLKQRIEDLIDRGYLSRNSDGNHVEYRP